MRLTNLLLKLKKGIGSNLAKPSQKQKQLRQKQQPQEKSRRSADKAAIISIVSNLWFVICSLFDFP